MKQILCLDDEQSVLRSLSRLFMDEEDYDVMLVNRGLEALDLLKVSNPAVIISDYRMPEMNGVEFLKQAKLIRPEALRIILSGYADASVIVQLINDGEIYKFIPKPWEDQEMLLTIRHAIEQFELVQENKRLTQQVIDQNGELQRLNEDLERRVAERTRELTYKNQALQIAHTILDQVSVGILGLGDDGIIVQANQAAGCLLGIPAMRLLGRSIHSVLPPELREDLASLHEWGGAPLSDEVLQQRIASLSDKGFLCIPQTDGAECYGYIVQLLKAFPAQSSQEDEERDDYVQRHLAC